MKVSGGRKFVSLALAAAYLLSRMSYYQIGQFYGLMESLGLWAAVGLLYGVYVYVNEKRASAYFWANGLYFLASFIHERYMVLLPVLLLGLVFGRWAGIREKSSREWSVGSPKEEEVPQRCRTEPLQGQPLRIPQDRPFRRSRDGQEARCVLFRRVRLASAGCDGGHGGPHPGDPPFYHRDPVSGRYRGYRCGRYL